MRGPYRVVKVLSHGHYELQLLASSYGKLTQAAAEFMVPWRGEWTPDTCAAFFENAESDETESVLDLPGSEVALPNGAFEPVPSTSSGVRVAAIRKRRTGTSFSQKRLC